MKSKAFVIAAISSLLIIAMLFVTNHITSWGYPWFVYPAFAVLWWPLSVYFAVNNNFTMYSVAASILTTAFFVLANFLTSAYPWFIYPVFVIWWWPLSMMTVKRNKGRLFSIIGSVYTVVFFIVANLVSSPSTVWFIYPVFAVLWWPISQVLCGKKKYKLYSIVASVYIIAFLALVNFITSPSYIWFIYPAFAVVWWPISMFFAKKYPKVYSVVMSAAIIAFLAVVNLNTSPSYIWFYQVVFFILWWPVVTLLGKSAKSFTFAAVSALVIIAYFVLQYTLESPGEHPWYLYTIFPVVWWPVCIAFKKHIAKIAFLLTSLLCMIAYYGVLNLLLAPSSLWSLYLLYPALWIVMGIFFGARKRYFGLSICASIVTIAFFVIVNYMTSPTTIWAVYPSFAIVWWPLSIFFFRYKRKPDIKLIKEAAE